jgi:spermidine dehydrogenase
MADDTCDRKLGMGRRITRRDFLDGFAIAVGGSVMGLTGLSSKTHEPADSTFAPEKSPDYYPPALVGMRGDHEGTYTYAHRLRDGEFWDGAGAPEKLAESYDLVIAGGGISGLAAAYFYRKQAGPNVRILILDNHDDFGGHAKRNEFRTGNRHLLAYGGTQSIENPSAYSKVSKDLIHELGIETDQFYKDYDQKLYSKLGTACFFDRETFGEDRLVTGMNSTPWPEFLGKTPLTEIARRDIARVYTEKTDYFEGLSLQEKRAKLAHMSFADFLTKVCKVHEDALPFFQKFPHDLYGAGIEIISALACYENGDDYESFTYPGFDGLDLGEPELEKEDPYIFHFPDGNASVARLLVRSLIPGVIPGHTMDDIVTARADYSCLDLGSSHVRLRLNATVAQARHTGAVESAKEVEVAYVRGGKLQSVRAKSCVLACHNAMIPYLCPELPEKQKDALHYCVKVPLVYTRVAIRNWAPFQSLGIHQIVAPGSYHSHVALDFPVSMGEYKFPSRPGEPMVLFMLRTPCKPGLPRKDQYRAGREELLRTPFSMFERNVRDQLYRMLGASGFDPAQDINGITVNRWAHGYSYEYDSLSDPEWPAAERPCVVGRQRFGRISIANSDAGARAYTDSAIDQAYRAIQEVLQSA